MQTAEIPSSPFHPAQTDSAPRREILDISTKDPATKSAAPSASISADAVAPAMVAQNLVAGERTATPAPDQRAARPAFRLPPALALKLQAGGAALGKAAKAHGPLIGVMGLVFAAGLTLGVAGAGLITPPESPEAQAARNVQAMLQWKGAMAIGPAATQPDNPRIAADIRALRSSLDAMRAGLDDLRGLDKRVASLTQSIERVRSEATQSASQTNAQLERSRSESAAAIGALSTSVKAMEQSAREPAARLAQIAERLERMEKGAPLTTASIQPGLTSQPAEPAPAAGAAKARILSGWAVVEVRGSLATLEGPDGLYEVARGQTVPTLGKIESFERKGRGWQVVTSRGVVEPAMR